MKLLVAVPSPRKIPEVMEHWDTWKYDTLIVKNTPQLEAYTRLRNYFVNRPEYTHICMIPDDLIVPTDRLTELWRICQDKSYDILSGYCNIDETQPNTYNLQNYVYESEGPPVSKGNWLEDKDIPDLQEFQVEFSGFPCMIISREVLTRVSWVGANKENNGNFDWRFCYDAKKLGYKINVASGFKFYHMRMAQLREVKEWKKTAKETDGYIEFLKHEP